MTTGKIFIYPKDGIAQEFMPAKNYGRSFFNLFGQMEMSQVATPTKYANGTNQLADSLINPNNNYQNTSLNHLDLGHYIKYNVLGNTDPRLEEATIQPAVLKSLVGANVATNFPANTGDSILLYSSLGVRETDYCPDYIEAYSTQAGIYAIDVLIFPLKANVPITQHAGFTSFITDVNGNIIGVNFDTSVIDSLTGTSIQMASITLTNANQITPLSLISDLFKFGSVTKNHMVITARYLAAPSITNTVSFTGDTTIGSQIIGNVSSITGLRKGLLVSGAGIPVGTYITNVSSGQIVVSNLATATATGVSLTAVTSLVFDPSSRQFSSPLGLNEVKVKIHRKDAENNIRR